MTLETYRNFLAIVDCGNILAASQKLMVAQPALSTQLKNLEQSLGVKLMNRSPKGVTLTPAGEIFYQKAQIICHTEASAYKEINDYVNGVAGTLKLSLPPSNPESLMERMFTDFVNAHPNVHYEIFEVLSSEVAKHVRDGISEIGMIRSRIRGIDDFHVYPYESEEIMVIVTKNHPLAKHKTVKLEQLLKLPIATTIGHIPVITAAFQTLMTVPDIHLSTSSRTTAIKWAIKHNLAALVSCDKYDLEPYENTAVLRIRDYDFLSKRAFITLKGRELSPIARDFLNCQSLQPEPL